MLCQADRLPGWALYPAAAAVNAARCVVSSQCDTQYPAFQCSQRGEWGRFFYLHAQSLPPPTTPPSGLSSTPHVYFHY